VRLRHRLSRRNLHREARRYPAWGRLLKSHDQRQVWRYLRQFPSPCSPNRSLLRQACLNSPQTSLRAGRWQISRYLRQLPSPCSPRTSLFSQARRNCSHCPPRPTRTPPGPISIDWEKAGIGINKRAAAAAAANEHLRALNISNPPTWLRRRTNRRKYITSEAGFRSQPKGVR
jgi:hypothetical protein